MNLYNKEFSDKGILSGFGRKKLETEKILSLLNPDKDDVILEVGCNKGELVKFLRKYGTRIYGVDINEDAIKSSDVKGLKVMQAEKMDFPEKMFNKIVSIHTIEHIIDLEKTFQEIERVLKPGGICVLIYPFEVIRGINNFIPAWWMYKTPFASRRLHVHRLYPKKVAAFTKMTMIDKGIFFGPFPTRYTVFRK